MKVLVTGAEGFVGKAIVNELVKNKFSTYQLANVKPGKVKSELKANLYRADISDYQSLAAAVKNFELDVFIHSAGLAHQFARQNKEDFWKINVLGTENAARLAVSLKAAHFILISSVSVYGAQTADHSASNAGAKEITEAAECNPQGFYALSKCESEKVARRICEANGVALTILRLAAVIGEGDRGNMARLIDAVNKKRFVWIGNGDNLKSLVYKGDVGRACVKIVGRTGGTEVYNITGEALEMKKIVAEICRRLEKKMPRLTISPVILENFFGLNSKTLKIKKFEDLAVTLKKWLSDDIFSGEKFKAAFKFQTETIIEEAIKRQVEFYRKQK